MKTITYEVQNVAREIGQYFLQRNGQNYAKAAEEIIRLRISKIEVKGEELTIVLGRPGLLIGRGGQVIRGLEAFLKAKRITVIEDETPLLDALIPESGLWYDY